MDDEPVTTDMMTAVDKLLAVLERLGIAPTELIRFLEAVGHPTRIVDLDG